jgi:hypothetical protein
MFPLLLNAIPLVGLDALIKIIQEFKKCYLWNAIKPTNPFFVTMQNWNWDKKNLIYLFEYLKTFLLIKFTKKI